MSVDHDFELPEARPADTARERAIFQAMTHFEQTWPRLGRGLPVRHGFHFADLLQRPGLRMVLVTGAALLIVVPVGVETIRKTGVEKEGVVNVEVSPPLASPIPAAPDKPETEAAKRPPALLTSPPVSPVAPSHADGKRTITINTAKSRDRSVPSVPTMQNQDSPAQPVDAISPLPPAPQGAEPRSGKAEEGIRPSIPVKPNVKARAEGSAEYYMQAAPRMAPDIRQLGGGFSARLGVEGDIQGPVDTPQARSGGAIGRDKFANTPENAFRSVAQEPVSTFSIDVDTASYSYVRAALDQNVLPRPDAVRTEEMINYFPYDYAPPRSASEPFSTTVTVMPNPWVSGHKLMRIGIKGYAIPTQEQPPANLVFLVDTSGSMDEPNKLPLLQKSLGMLVDTLRPQDKVAIVAYAGSAGVVLPPTVAADKSIILAALDKLHAGGSTAGGEGIRLAYQLAEANFDARAVNRVMLATDGDFNVGIANQDELRGFVGRQRGKGIFLSVLGFGMGNLNDSMMQALAQNGNGAAAYIDTLNEARKVLVEEATSSLFPIAKDVKIQVEFNPAAVSDYRLIGYETRMLNTEDFNNDKVDAGDVGSGSTVTAIYDFVPAGAPRPVDASRYQVPSTAPAPARQADEYAFLKIRYKLPKADTSRLIATPVTHAEEVETTSQAPLDARFAVAVAGFGEWLRGGKHTGSLTPDDLIALAKGAKGEDPFGYRTEFVNLVRAAKTARDLPAAQQ